MPENVIKRYSIASLGYNFIKPEFIPEGKDEYYLRDFQNKSGIDYRQLSAAEIEILVRNRNTSDNWNRLLVSDAFNPELVKNCKFYGLVRIGKLEAFCLEFSDLRLPVGLYNSTIISCDFGDNVVIDNVNYLSHYIIGSEVIIANVNELSTSDYAKFGNGVVKDGEDEEQRIWMELCNENGGRKIIPFNGMLPGDAFLWSKYRNETALLEKFKTFTEAKFDKQRGYYGKVGDRTVIKNCKIIKDVWIGSDAYLKGANKLKNLTINSGPEGKSQIGEGCEMVNGIMGFGCRAFYGIKAVRFIMASHSQLKYGARLINSYLGNNATISCCEVLNSLIFPAHEQHHNNSFLCASTVMGQSNIAAGATIGSNHNSRSPDGEIIAGRGFWPGLCVSLKHNSKFATYTMIAKGDYSNELNILTPFSLVSNDVTNDRLIVMPAYWFMYNMYAIARNSWKYIDRDKRTDKKQYLEYDYLAPDSVNEIFNALDLLKLFTGKAYLAEAKVDSKFSAEECVIAGQDLLDKNDPQIDALQVLAHGFENSKRKVQILKARQSYQVYKQLIVLYSVDQLFEFINANQFDSFDELVANLPMNATRDEWINVGGQLIPKQEVAALKQDVLRDKVTSWDELHDFYTDQQIKYPMQKLNHAMACLQQLHQTSLFNGGPQYFESLLDEAVATKEWMTKGIYESREKDYTNPYRQMVFDSIEEMNTVLGSLEDNSFIAQQQQMLQDYKAFTADLKSRFIPTLVTAR